METIYEKLGIMSNHYRELKLTDAQRLADESFLARVQDRCVVPLVEEAAREIEGFRDMDATSRLYEIVKLDEPKFGRGDWLPLGSAIVYAGRKLGREVELRFGDNVIAQYQPRFFADGPRAYRGIDLSTGSPSANGQPEGQEIDVDAAEDAKAVPVFFSDLGQFLIRERKTYDSLPLAYRAALLVLLVSMSVIAPMDEVIAFVLGYHLDSDTALETFRFSVDPARGNVGLYRGWNIRIRDTKPSRAFGVDLIRYAQDLEFYMSDLYGLVNFEDRLDAKRPRKARSCNPKTQLACLYVYELEQSGVVIDARKKGGTSWTKVLMDMLDKYGDKVPDYTPEDLSRVYRDWKKRNGLK